MYKMLINGAIHLDVTCLNQQAHKLSNPIESVNVTFTPDPTIDFRCYLNLTGSLVSEFAIMDENGNILATNDSMYAITGVQRRLNDFGLVHTLIMARTEELSGSKATGLYLSNEDEIASILTKGGEN